MSTYAKKKAEIAQQKQDLIIALAKDIAAANPGIAISGSLALIMQGFKLRRPVCDIDIYVPPGKGFNTLEGMKPVGDEPDEKEESFDDGYGEETELSFQRWEYKMDNIKIDVFKGGPDETPLKVVDGLVYAPDIIKMKFSHTMYDRFKGDKHLRDLIHILNSID